MDPDFGAYSEENPQDIGQGEAFAAAMINAVMHGPGWESTLLLWIYDEHGGYYDHVPPPAAVAPDDVPARNWQLSQPLGARALMRVLAEVAQEARERRTTGPVSYDRYGFRVPAVIVSPYARPDFVLQRGARPHLGAQARSRRSGTCPPLTRRDAAAVVAPGRPRP